MCRTAPEAFPKRVSRGGIVPTLSLNVNGSVRTLDVRDNAEPLLFVLRNRLSLTGAKYGCGLGQCGACTVLIDGEAARSCRVEVGSVAGKAITTIEGIGAGDLPHPVQTAFIAEQAAQCGYCIPGMVMSAVALLDRQPHPTRDEAKRALAGNLCRCGTHHRILNAVVRAGGKA
jgi:nicotinate dehydrogenase subunit A